MAAHARISASKSHRIIGCPGSLALEERVPPRTSSYAEEGTAAHDLASRVLNRVRECKVPVSATEYIEKRAENGIAFDDEMAIHVDTYVNNIVFMQPQKASCQLFVEQRVDYSDILRVPDSFGTADCISVIVENGRISEIQVHDLKYGRGVLVDAENNAQLMCYALGVINKLLLAGYSQEDLEDALYRLVIHQPRLRDAPSEWTCSYYHLMAFADELSKAAQLAIRLAGEAGVSTEDNEAIIRENLTPGEHQCRFCRAKAICPALREECLGAMAGEDDTAAAGLDFEDLDAVAPVIEAGIADLQQRSVALLDGLFPKLDLVELWLKAVRGEIETRLLQGVTAFTTCKLVQGRQGISRWIDDKTAEAALRKIVPAKQLYKKTLQSPTGIRKLLAANKKKLGIAEAFITRAEGKPHVAPISDPRPAITPDYGCVFTNLDETE